MHNSPDRKIDARHAPYKMGTLSPPRAASRGTIRFVDRSKKRRCGAHDGHDPGRRLPGGIQSDPYPRGAHHGRPASAAGRHRPAQRPQRHRRDPYTGTIDGRAVAGRAWGEIQGTPPTVGCDNSSPALAATGQDIAPIAPVAMLLLFTGGGSPLHHASQLELRRTTPPLTRQGAGGDTGVLRSCPTSGWP